MPNGFSNATKIARLMIQRHGLQASAVADERETLARLAPDAEAVELWHSVQLSISDLRSTPHAAVVHRPKQGPGV
jgi:hypothetical protein